MNRKGEPGKVVRNDDPTTRVAFEILKAKMISAPLLQFLAIGASLCLEPCLDSRHRDRNRCMKYWAARRRSTLGNYEGFVRPCASGPLNDIQLERGSPDCR